MEEVSVLDDIQLGIKISARANGLHKPKKSSSGVEINDARM